MPAQHKKAQCQKLLQKLQFSFDKLQSVLGVNANNGITQSFNILEGLRR